MEAQRLRAACDYDPLHRVRSVYKDAAPIWQRPLLRADARG
jgi:hypothetical protein